MTICIDLFAGPGGLGEGFTKAGFEIAISVEKQSKECQTLVQRKLHHALVDRGDLELARALALGDITVDDLRADETALVEECEAKVLQFELGSDPFADLHARISQNLKNKGREPLLLLGGPPCQAYSIVGRSRNIGKSKIAANPEALEEFYADNRHTLYREYLKVLAVFSPDVFIMENVRGILSAKTGPDAENGSVIKQIVADIQKPRAAMAKDKAFLKEVKALGASLADDEYDLFPLVTNDANDLFAEHEAPVAPIDFLIKSEEHGVPQTRHRVIICGIKKSLVKKRGWPQKLERQGETTLADVISSLPKLRSRITKQTVNDEDWEDVVGNEIKRLASVRKPELASNTTYEKRVKKARIKNNKKLSAFLEDALGPITEHKTRSHMLSDLARYYFCADYGERENCSPRISQWPTGEIAPQHKDIQRDGNQLTASSFVDRFKVQLWDKPSSTITSHISKDGHHFIHPDKTQCRSLSVREAARIQTFPDSYQFCGGISQQFHQIGNAVPPYLAFQIANILGKYLSAS